jgi:vancomycin permeability regulator SanA
MAVRKRSGKGKSRSHSRKRKTGVLRAAVRIVLACAIVAVLVVGATNIIVIASAKDRIVTADEAAAIAGDKGKFHCAEVLGAAVWNGNPSPMLAERIDTGMELVKNGATDILLYSGDNGTNEYNEVAAMKSYSIGNGAGYGVGEENIYLDYAGFSTYDSMYRLRDVFDTKRAVVVTQEYHLYRALYIADKLGIEVYGVAAAPRKSGQLQRDIREIFARTKDFFYVLTDHSPKYLGDTIELTYPSTQASN